MDEKLYDANHKRIGTRTKDAFGNDVIKDTNGRVISRMGEDILGNKVIRDSSGRTVGVYGQDMLGNDVEKGLLPCDMEILSRMVEDISYNNARRYFKFY